MAERETKTPMSPDCWPRASDVIAFRLGYLQATCDQILALVTALQADPKASGHPILSHLRRWAGDVMLLHKLWVAWRTVSLPAGLASWGYIAARWLGWL